MDSSNQGAALLVDLIRSHNMTYRNRCCSVVSAVLVERIQVAGLLTNARKSSRQETCACAINTSPPTIRNSFRAFFIRMKGPGSGLAVRVILIETAGTESIYEGFGTWRQFRRRIVQISGCVILWEQFAVVQKRLELNRMATIDEVQASFHDLESVGFRRATN